MSTTTPPHPSDVLPSRSGSHAAPSVPASAGKLALPQLARFTAVAVQLGLLILVVRTFAVENAAFLRMLLVGAAGFVLHHFAPAQLRMPVFVGVSLAGMGLVLGVGNAAQIVGLGLVLIGLAHLPVAFPWRVTLILLVAGLLAALRIDLLSSPLSSAIWPIFGAMFMFRLIVYLYDLHNRDAPFSPWHAMSYFFMLPTVCFPLFPVVDYKTFCRTRYDQEDIRVYQTGVEWMFRGVIQLLLYRWVYQNLLVGAASVTTALDAAKFLVTAYLMYLKISGSFHVIVGMLHLFGFNLHRTNNKYFLSEGFTDYWRRINIYWKDFLEKIFFKPLYFRFSRRMGATRALVAATLVAFLVTWALHSYQWFWIRGSFPVVWQDIVFWSIMGLLVLGNMLYENKYGRQRSLRKVRHSAASELKLALRTVGTFVVVCTSWVIWSTESLGEFKMVVGRLAHMDAVAAGWILASLSGLGVVAVVVARADRRKVGAAVGLARLKAQKAAPTPIWWGSLRVSASCSALVVLAYLPLVVSIDPRVSNALDSLKSSRLNQRDAQMLDRGYYEDLTNVTRFNSALGDLYAQKPPNWDRCWALHPVDGYPDFALMPNKKVVFKGATMTTNRWGMRDRDYEKQKPPGTFRIAVLGASHVMGSGVTDDQVVDNLVEDQLNREHGSTHYELLNFAVGGYGPVQRLADMDHRVFDFEPDALLAVGINDLHWVVKDLVEAAINGWPLPYEHLVDILREEGLDENTSRAEGFQKLAPRREELLAWVYGQMVQRCRERGIRPLAAFIPQPKDERPEARALIERQMDIARQAGFTVIDMLDAYTGEDYAQLKITPFDGHPNARGHELLAEKLYPGLVASLGLEAGPAGSRR
jgi:D-alanyl-lipoteichoic acid acyltransferase DltB (MBOAT superfamily)